MSIQLITAIAWGGVLTAALVFSLVANGKIATGTLLARVLDNAMLGLSIATVATALVLHAPVAVVMSGIWLLTVIRTYPRMSTELEVEADDDICPRKVNSAAADAWSSVAGQGGSMGFGSMTRLTA